MPIRRLAPLVLALLASACAPRHARPLALPPPADVSALGPGDVFEVHIVGEDKLPTTFMIAPDGTVDLPYIQRQKVAGLEPQDLAEAIRARLIEKEILSDPSVSVSVKEYNSKRIEVLGEVQKPGSLPIQPGMTLLRAISLSGGFNSIADKSRVTIRRRVGGGTRAATVSVEDIIDNRIPDPPLQAGDSINVEQRYM
ncbi:MAG: polysaccharide biosynthesis/export family protein [Byssovorax sp.]